MTLPLVGPLLDNKKFLKILILIPDNDIKTQCVPVPKINRISEADFLALDRLQKNAPQKSTLAKSGIINYTNNKTSTFLNQISRDKGKK